MKTILLTGARAPVTLDLARALTAAGHRVIAAESMGYPISIHSNAFAKFYFITAPNSSLPEFQNDLIQIIEKEKVEILIPTCEEAFHISKIKDVLSLKTKVMVDSFEKLSRLHSKVEFNHWVKEIGLSAPKTIRATTVTEIAEAVAVMPGSKVVLKPEFSRFASKTLVLDKKEALSILSEITNGKPWAVQECLIGPEYCTYSFAKDGKLVAHVTYEHEFTAGKGAGICFKSIHHAKIEAWISRFVQETNFTGQIAFDFIENSSGDVQPLECNPRATSGLHLIAHHQQYLDALIGLTDSATTVRPQNGTQGQLRLAMLAYGLPSIRNLKSAISWIQIFFGAREVVFSLKDPAPFFDQFISFYRLISEAKKSKITPLEVSTKDIEWNGP
jgi:predicted ATP-grasp superfamily ATP-dependent carboligase